MFGSGQWTIWEGTLQQALHEGRLPLQQYRPNACHCMASAVAGFMRTFGIDEPMGCYDDISRPTPFVLWGSNMAEMHPHPNGRASPTGADCRHVKVHVLSTFEHRSCELAADR